MLKSLVFGDPRRAQLIDARGRWHAMVMCGAVLITSCTDSSTNGTSQTTNDHQVIVEPQSQPVTSTAADIDFGLSDFEGFFWPDTENEHAYSLQIETAIATCMHKHGFDYVSSLPTSAASGHSTASGTLTTTKADFGVVDSYVQSKDHVTGTDPSAALFQYLDTLGAAERSEYEHALWGNPEDPESTADSCTGVANTEEEASIPRFQAPYQKILDDYYTRLRTDPRLVAAELASATCLEASTGLLVATGSPLHLSRSNMEYAVRADIAVRLGRSIRWVTAAEADQINPATLAQPYEITVDESESGIGLVAYGPIKLTDSATLEDARAREHEIFDESERCWAESGGAEVVTELQADVMRQAEPLMASANP